MNKIIRTSTKTISQTKDTKDTNVAGANVSHDEKKLQMLVS